MGRSGSPRLVRFLARHAAIGGLVAAVAVVGILAADLSGLRSLIFGSAAGLLGGCLLLAGLTVTFASVQMGVAIMLLPWEDDRPGGHREWPMASRPAAAASPHRSR